MTPDLATLKRLAEAATDQTLQWGDRCKAQDHLLILCDPRTILALVAELERARKVVVCAEDFRARNSPLSRDENFERALAAYRQHHKTL